MDYNGFRQFASMLLAFDCLLVAYLYNSTCVAIQIGFGLSVLFVIVFMALIIIRTLKSKGLRQLSSSFKPFIYSKRVNYGCVLVLAAIFSFCFTTNWHEILSYIFFGIGELALMASCLINGNR